MDTALPDALPATPERIQERETRKTTCNQDFKKSDRTIHESASAHFLQQWLALGYYRNIRCIYEYNVKISA